MQFLTPGKIKVEQEMKYSPGTLVDTALNNTLGVTMQNMEEQGQQKM